MKKGILSHKTAAITLVTVMAIGCVSCGSKNEVGTEQKETTTVVDDNQDDESIDFDETSGQTEDTKDTSGEDLENATTSKENENQTTMEDETAPTVEEEDTTLSEGESAAQAFYEKNYGGMSLQEIDQQVLDRSGYIESSSFYETAMNFWRNERDITDMSYRLVPLFYTDMLYYSEEDFQSLPLDILILAQSEIYARHGCQFKDENIENYFMGCVWYNSVEGLDNFDSIQLNEFEKHNNDILLKLIMAE